MQKFTKGPIIDKAVKSARDIVSDFNSKSRDEKYEVADKEFKGIEKEIFDVQITKQKVMKKLKESIKKIESGRNIAPAENAKKVLYNENTNCFEYSMHGQNACVTFGDIVSDLKWGVEYDLGENCPKIIQKQLLLEKAKSEIFSLYDKQLMQIQMSDPSVNEKVKLTYDLRLSPEKELAFFEKASGSIFEKMVKNLLNQITIDLPDLGIVVEDVNSLQDVEGKIDFILKFKKNVRAGVIEEIKPPIPEDQNAKSVMGIQFTMVSGDGNSEQRKKFNYKMDQIEKAKKEGLYTFKSKIDDLVLISVPVSSKEVIKKYNDWKALGKPPGGPESMFDINTRIEFLKTLLNGMGGGNIIEEKKKELVEYYNKKIPSH